MLASHGDTLDARAIVRFDTLPQTFTARNVDRQHDHAARHGDARHADRQARTRAQRPTAPVTIEAYNVDTRSATRTPSAAILATLFRPDRFLGIEDVRAGVAARHAAHSDLRRTRCSTACKNGNAAARRTSRLVSVARLRHSDRHDARRAAGRAAHQRVDRHGGARPSIVTPLSTTPTDQAFLSGPLADYTIVVKGGDDDHAATLLGVGGVPSRRAFLRFNVPSRIVDSTTIVRASLLLTQIAESARRRRTTRSTSIPSAVLASPVGHRRAIAAAVRRARSASSVSTRSRWRRATAACGRSRSSGSCARGKDQPTTVSPRALALRSGAEGQLPGADRFLLDASAPARCDRDCASRTCRRPATGCHDDTTPSLVRALWRACRLARWSSLRGSRRGARAQANLSTQGFGFPTGQFSTRALGTGGAIGGDRSAVAGESGEHRAARVAHRRSSRSSRSSGRSRRRAARSTRPRRRAIRTCSARFPSASGLVVSLGASTLLDRTSTTTFNTTQILARHRHGADDDDVSRSTAR